jgi:alpha-ketoglutarate-dependent taurine dioxygenase
MGRKNKVMQVTKMAAPLGAIVDDLDVRSVDESTASKLNELFCQHHVLVFPNQQLTPDDQVAFAQHWGELVPFPYGSLPGQPNIIELRNKGKKKGCEPALAFGYDLRSGAAKAHDALCLGSTRPGG